MNDVEVRRDPSHTWNMSPSDWRRALEDRGFRVTDEAMTKVYHEFDDWTGRSGTPAGEVERLRRDLLNAPAGAVDAFDIRQEDGRLRFFWAAWSSGPGWSAARAVVHNPAASDLIPEFLPYTSRA